MNFLVHHTIQSSFLQICPSTLKRVCRKQGIKTWPHVKRKSSIADKKVGLASVFHAMFHQRCIVLLAIAKLEMFALLLDKGLARSCVQFQEQVFA